MKSQNIKIYISLSRPVKLKGPVKEMVFSNNRNELYLYQLWIDQKNRARKKVRQVSLSTALKYASYISGLKQYEYIALVDIQKGIQELKNDYKSTIAPALIDENMLNNISNTNFETVFPQ